MIQKKKVVLAFSGGLDTSFCALYLQKEKNLEVHAILVNTGGFSEAEIKRIQARAIALGVHHFEAINYTQPYYEKCLKYLVFGNVLRNNTYPLSVSSERVFQALAIAEYAQKVNAEAIAHGSTGAGNDQVRFDLAFQVLLPHIEIITPIRDMQLSREEEIDYLRKAGIEMDFTKSQYSYNYGLWGTSVGGKETLTSHEALPESAYPHPIEKTEPQALTLLFAQGELKGINAQTFENPVEALQTLEQIARGYGIGRDIHVGDTIIGIKGRVGFEAASALITIKAHALLEKHTLGKWQIYWKEQLANWYGMFLHEAQYLDPVMRHIELFLEDTQKNVTGKVFVQLHPYRFELQGIESAFDLMQSKFGTYGEMNRAWEGEDVKGFIKILANSLKIQQSTNKF